MKTKWYLLAVAALSLMMPHEAGANGACTAARFHDWNDMGCNQNYAGAGAVSSGKNNAGGNQSSCNGDCGMPRWWVSEPYINLFMSDTPLSYKTSSGQEMDFTMYYKQGYKLPDPDEVPNFYVAGSNLSGIHSQGDYYFQYARTFGMNNAAWANNWMKDIVFWDAQWEDSTYTQTLPPFTKNYEALVFNPQGNIDYFYSTNNNSQVSLKNPASQLQLKPLSALSYPTVNSPTADTNGVYWGGSQTNGFQITYPDGSRDIFGLCYYPIGLINNNLGKFYTGAHAFLTQKIDPQGRVTSLGYEYKAFTNFWDCAGRNNYYIPEYSGYRLKYVVDTDGRTNTFIYNNNATTNSYSWSHCCIEDTTSLVLSALPPRHLWQIAEIDDPYGRKNAFTYDNLNGALTSITDAAGLVSSFQYNNTKTTASYLLPDPANIHQSGGSWPTNIAGMSLGSGWITNLTTPYGNSGFSYYQVPDSTVIDGYQQRAIYVSEPTGANQLYYYLHKGVDAGGNPLFVTTATAPTVPGQTNFDDGNSGVTHPTLQYRNSIHWGRRQFADLATSVQSALPGSLSNALANLTISDFRKGRVCNWLWQSDSQSMSEFLSSERGPSPDVAGQIEGERTWYNYPGKTLPEVVGSSPQVSCIARLLPDSTSQYTTYNYYATTGFPSPPAGAGLVSDNESSYSQPGGSTGALTNWFNYATNNIDLVSVNNSAGQSVNYAYNSHHQITSVTNALNQVATLSWDGSTFNLTGVQLPSSKSYTLTYYSATNPPSSTSSLLHEISISPEGRTFTVNSYSAGLSSSITDDRGLTVNNTWDGLNRLTGAAFPDGTSVSNIYNRLDLVASEDRLNNWTYYAFDGLQHLVAVTNANNGVTSYSWCGCGSLNQIVDALNNYTTLNYDNQGNLTNVAFPDSSSLTWQYDLLGRMTNAFDGAGRAVGLAYNNQGLPTSITSANGTLRSTTYDALNRPISVTDANGITVTNQYDTINELLKRTWPDGISEGYGFSAAGLVAYTNRDQKVTLYGRDGAGRLTAVTNANSEITQFGYDSLDNVISLIDGLGHTTSWQYNQYGWLTNKVDGLGRTAFQYAYNANGWVTTRWTPEKGNTGYSYDNAGNLQSVTYPSSTISYAYDALNRLTNMVDAVGTTAFGYTPAGRLQSENGPWTSDTVSYAYVQGLRTNLTLSQTSSNWSQSYGFDSGWRMTNTVSPAGAFVYGYNFQPASSLVTGIRLPNWASITNSFDSLGRLTQTSLNNYWGHPLDSYTYMPDARGLRTNIVRNLGLTSSTVSAGFDNIGQLTSWNASDAGGALRQNEQLGFGYDAAHNLHSRNNGGLAQTFNVDAANELTSVSRTGTFTVSGATPAPATNVTVNGQLAQTYGDFTFASTNNSLTSGANTFTIIAQNAYGVAVTNNLTLNLPSSVSLNSDGNGSLTNDGTLLFAYNTENQLTNMTLAGVWKSDFVYDGLNRRRIERDYIWQGGSWASTNETRFIYDGYLLLQERDTNNNALATYTRGLDLSGSLQGAGGIGGLLARTDTNGSTFYHADGVGNITALMDGSENIVARYLYNPFGKLLGEWGSMANVNSMQFSSMPVHRLSGMPHLPFRDLDTTVSQFLTADPMGEAGGTPLHGFARNNPLSYIDPTGKAPQLVSITYNLGSGQSSAQYQPSQFGQGYGIGLHNPPSSPLDMLNAYNDWQDKQNQIAAQKTADFFGHGNDPQAVEDIFNQLSMIGMMGFPESEFGEMSKLGKTGKFCQKKPGKLGQFKGVDALRRENDMVGDAVKAVGEGLSKDEKKDLQRELHDLLHDDPKDNYNDILNEAKLLRENY
jgi:RHS repeat-associated protein